LTQPQSSAKVKKKWRASDEPDLMVHSRREHRTVGLRVNTMSRIKPNGLWHLWPDTV